MYIFQHHRGLVHIDFKGRHGWRSECVLAYNRNSSSLPEFSMPITRPHLYVVGAGGLVGIRFLSLLQSESFNPYVVPLAYK